MTAVQIALRSNPAKYSFAGNAKLINAYAEKHGDDGKAPYAVLPCPGMISCCEVTDTPGRGIIYLDDLDCAYSVHSSSVYKVTKTSDSPFTLTATRIGTVAGTDQVQLSRNQAEPPQISIHSALGEYYIENDVVQPVIDVDVTSETIVTTENVGGFSLYGAQSGKFLLSGQNDAADVDGLDFATAEQMADRLVRAVADRDEVGLFGTETTEWWRNTGQADFPLEPIGGSTMKKGLLSAQGVVSYDNSLAWPGQDRAIYRKEGYAPKRISTHYIERLLTADPAASSIKSFGYSLEGHVFAGWTGTDYTVAIDAATGFWHNRESWQMSVWRGRNTFSAWGKNICQDSQSGELFYLDPDTFTEDGNPLIWGVDTAFLVSPTGAGIVDALQIDIATGVGALLASAQGYDPILMLSWSVDGGATWKGNRNIPIHRRGNRLAVRTRRLGRFDDKGIQFRLRVSDPVIRSLIGITAKVRTLDKKIA